MSVNPRHAGLLAAALVALSGAPAALAQNALGDGRALDANLRVGSGGRNPDAIDFRSEVQFRNAIVTGNVPAAFAFRGDVGYSAADDFRGELGSNDFFEIQRDSFFSSIGTRDLGGIVALQTSLDLSVGGQLGGLSKNALIVNRSGVGATAGTVRDSGRNRPATLDIFGSVENIIRTPSDAIIRDGIERPSILGTAVDQRTGTTRYVGASDLMGVRDFSINDPSFGVTDRRARNQAMQRLLDADAATNDTPGVDTPPGLPGVTPSMPAIPGIPEQIDADTEPTVSGQRVQPQRANAAYERLLSGLASASAERVQNTGLAQRANQPIETQTQDAPGAERATTNIAEQMAREAEALNALLDDIREGVSIENESTRATDAAGDPDPEADPDPESEGDAQPADPIERAMEIAERVLGATRVELEDLAPPGAADPRYARHIEQGTADLRAGEWFRAEERFTAALQIAPGDPMAAAGRVNAQIGAGMYLSAGVNLRRLLRAYPELMAARFDESLLPGGERLDRIRGQLRDRTQRISPLSRDAALLLAYLGIQTENPQDVYDGLTRLRELTDMMDAEADPLDKVLRRAWLRAANEMDPAATAAPAREPDAQNTQSEEPGDG
jgi:hypothetical protein